MEPGELTPLEDPPPGRPAPPEPAADLLEEASASEFVEATPIPDPPGDDELAPVVAVPGGAPQGPPALWGGSLPEDALHMEDLPRDVAAPPRAKKRPGAYGPVSLLPGIEDAYLGLFVLGVIWLGLTAVAILAPAIAWFPLVVGALLWVGGGCWFQMDLSDADPFWRYGFAFVPFFSVFYVVAHRDRAVRPFLVTVMGMLLTFTGWWALKNYYGKDSNPDESRAVSVMRAGRRSGFPA
jgi:hypothetical protein